MEIKPIKKIKPVKQSVIHSEDLLQRPSIKAAPQLQDQDTFQFINQKLLFDGKDVGQFINETVTTQPELLASIAGGLEEFKKQCLKKRKRSLLPFNKQVAREYSEEELGTIFALCDAYIKKISDLIQKRYDETKDGMTVMFDENGQLILNGMNIHALVNKCRENPNPKSLIFLKGIRQRLDRVLENKINSRNYDRIHEVIMALFDEIDRILKA